MCASWTLPVSLSVIFLYTLVCNLISLAWLHIRLHRANFPLLFLFMYSFAYSKWSCRWKRKTKEYQPPPHHRPFPLSYRRLSLLQTKEGPRAGVCLCNIAKKRLYSGAKACIGGWRGSGRWVFLAKKQNERQRERLRERGEGRERAKRKNEGTGDPFRFYTTVNSNCTRWLMAFPFSLLFAKIPSYTSLISHSHANEDRSCNDILRWETPGLRWWRAVERRGWGGRARESRI